ncbi:MAG: peptidoglycan DD-metalloendopeptidase family protein [Synergistaceae bacterium]|nr:peptidoglycan DD-metalloendopeptidase family protein [Synergistaceae bacterium]
MIQSNVRSLRDVLLRIGCVALLAMFAGGPAALPSYAAAKTVPQKPAKTAPAKKAPAKKEPAKKAPAKKAAPAKASAKTPAKVPAKTPVKASEPKPAASKKNASEPLAVPQSPGDLEKMLDAQEKQLEKMQAQIKTGEEQINKIKKQENVVIKEIATLSNRLSESEQRLKITELKRNQVAAKLFDTTTMINETEERLNKAKSLLGGRMVAVYKYGGASEFNLFMSANGAQEALATSYLLARIAEQDKSLISELQLQKGTLDKARAELVKQKAELEDRNKELESQKNTIQKTSQERNKLLEKVRKDKALFQAEQDELLRASGELKGKVNELLSAKKKMQQANKAAATPLYYKGGRIAWPLRGNITSPYGTRIHPVFKTKATHTGIDIDGNKGDPVRAAADGEVLYTGWLRGYGQVVILDHGGDLTTVYGHLSGIDAAESAKVKMGDIIGRVGSTGIATGNHLHFEVRVNGNTTDPMKYLQ